MKAFCFALLLTICAIECRKIVQINKNANIDFINMESGGGGRPYSPPARPAAPVSPQKSEPPKTPVEQSKPVAPVTTPKPVVVTVPAIPTPSKPVQPSPSQGLPNHSLQPAPVKPGQAAGITTPGYGNVKQLVTFYDSKGQASVIRPYSYSQAVKQG